MCISETSATQHIPRHGGRVEAVHLHALTGSAPPRRHRCEDVESAALEAPWRTMEIVARKSRLSGCRGGCLTTTRLNSHLLTPAHSCSRYRCVTAGSIQARKNPLHPSETRGCRGFSVAGCSYKSEAAESVDNFSAISRTSSALCQIFLDRPSNVANSSSDSPVFVNYWVTPSSRIASSSSSTSQPSRFCSRRSRR